MKRVLIVLLFLTVACAHKPLPLPPAGTVEVIAANPAKGFSYPYLLKIPSDPGDTVLLVEPNNTGQVSDDFEVHVDAAKKLINSGVGAYVAKQLDIPFVMPIFPRPETGWERYTHALDRDTMVIEDGPMHRLDRQLLAMIDDARKRLRAYGVNTKETVMLAGFSASATFVNRFTLLYPERVGAVAAGGLNGMLIVPSATLDATPLPYPLGISDLEQVTGVRFDAAKWRAVPQFLYMGAKDDNDAVQYDDAYNEAERATVYKVFGEKMQPDRWTLMQKLYRDAGAKVEFRTYEHMGHGTDKKINDEVTDFFRTTITSWP